jgi:hypothetical protein
MGGSLSCGRCMGPHAGWTPTPASSWVRSAGAPTSVGRSVAALAAIRSLFKSLPYDPVRDFAPIVHRSDAFVAQAAPVVACELGAGLRRLLQGSPGPGGVCCRGRQRTAFRRAHRQRPCEVAQGRERGRYFTGVIAHTRGGRHGASCHRQRAGRHGARHRARPAPHPLRRGGTLSAPQPIPKGQNLTQRMNISTSGAWSARCAPPARSRPPMA